MDGNNNFLKSTELWNKNGEKVAIEVDLPEAIIGHCMVNYENTIMVIGGYGGGPAGGPSKGKNVWNFNAKNNFVQTNEFTKEMNHGRWGHACGIYHSAAHSGRPLLVVAGAAG